MKCCAALLLLCIFLGGGVHADNFLSDCGAGLVNNEGAEVRISTVPDGVWVSIDNNPLGATPYQENLGLKGFAYGQHTVVLTKPGYETVVKNIQLCYPYLTELRVDMQKSAPLTTPTTLQAASMTTPVRSTKRFAAEYDSTPAGDAAVTGSGGSASSGGDGATGSLSVTTTPPGAEIYLDGTIRGMSPVTIPDLKPGSHVLLLRMQSYGDLTVPLTITAGETLKYAGVLQTASGTAGSAGGVPRTTTAPGFDAVPGLAVLGAVLVLRNCRQ
jgi:hypothetical protein